MVKYVRSSILSRFNMLHIKIEKHVSTYKLLID